jgi:hypothetical protein
MFYTVPNGTAAATGTMQLNASGGLSLPPAQADRGNGTINVGGGYYIGGTNMWPVSLGGDLTGSGGPAPAAVSARVTGLQGIPVAQVTPANLQVLTYIAAQNEWLPANPSGGGGGGITEIDTGTGLTGGPITSTGTIALATPVALGNGGTGVAATSNANLLDALFGQSGAAQGFLVRASSGTYTSLLPLPLSTVYGGTGQSSFATGSFLMGSGVGNPVTAQPSPLPVSLGGTGAATAAAGLAALGGISAPVSLTTQVSGILPVANGGSGIASLPAGELVQGNGTSPVSGVALPLAIANGGTGAAVAKAALFRTAGTANTQSSSTTGVMMGYGVNFRITPTVSGRIFFAIQGQVASAGASPILGLNYGSGTPPAYNTAIVGTNITQVTYTPAGDTYYIPWCIVGFASVTAGTAYWFDLTLAIAGTGAPATVSSVVGFAFEV